MITKKIAKNGMKGRKRATILLSAVLSLTFLFIVIATTLQTSITKTKEDKRLLTYGNFEAAYMSDDGHAYATLSKEDSLSLAISRNVASSDNCGVVGTINDDIKKISNFSFLQGTYPANDDEILIESNIATSLGLDNAVGNTITVQMYTPILDISADDYLNDMTKKIAPDYVANDNNYFDCPVKTYTHHTVETEFKDNSRITFDSQYIIAFSADESVPSPEDIIKNGLLFYQSVTITKDFTISGVIKSYSGNWDCGNFILPSSFITESAADTFLSYLNNTTLTDNLRDYNYTSNIFINKDYNGKVYDKYKNIFLNSEQLTSLSTSDIPFRRNTFSYPVLAGSAENSLTFMIIGIIFIASACAIFQIFLTQMKKRSRKLALLKSIGTTNGQIFAILMWEGLYELIICLPLGTLTGLIITYLATLIMNHAGGLSVSFHIDIRILLLALITGCIALFIGMAIPMIIAIRTPLVGAISVKKSRKKRSTRNVIGSSNRHHALTFSYITKQHNRMNRTSRTLSFSLSLIIICIILFCSYLSYNCFDSYRDNNIRTDRPSYTLYANHGMTLTSLSSICKDIKALDASIHTDYYKYGNHAYFTYNSINDSELFNTYKERFKHEDNYSDYIGIVPDQEYEGQRVQDDLSMIEGSVITSIYAIDPSTDIYNRIKSLINYGTVNDSDFAKGDSVILMIPIYDEDTFSYDGRFKDSYKTDDSLTAGDFITLSTRIESATADNLPIAYTTINDVKVDGIIYYFPNNGLWPFSEDMYDTDYGVKVISGINLAQTLYPQMATDPVGNELSLSQFEKFFLKQCPYAYGNSVINIYMNSSADNSMIESSLFTIASNYGLTLINYNEQTWSEYYKALNSSFMIILMGLSATAIALIILGNINMSAFEQERKRIGILQSMGITNHDFALTYMKKGLIDSCFSLIIVHIIMFVIILTGDILTLKCSKMTFLRYISDIFNYALKDYWWRLHIALCILFVAAIVVISYLPVRKLRRYSPIENINSNER